MRLITNDRGSIVLSKYVLAPGSLPSGPGVDLQWNSAVGGAPGRRPMMSTSLSPPPQFIWLGVDVGLNWWKVAVARGQKRGDVGKKGVETPPYRPADPVTQMYCALDRWY